MGMAGAAMSWQHWQKKRRIKSHCKHVCWTGLQAGSAVQADCCVSQCNAVQHAGMQFELLSCAIVHCACRQVSSKHRTTSQWSNFGDSWCVLQALTLWLQYISMVGSTNVPAPNTVTWLFSASGFAFSSITSGALSTDCLISPYGAINPALKRMVLRLAVPWFSLAILLIGQVLR